MIEDLHSDNEGTELGRRAWLLAASRMSRPARVMFRMQARGWKIARIARRLRISQRRVERYLVEAIGQVARAYDEIEPPG